MVLMAMLAGAAMAQTLSGGATGPGVPAFGVRPGYRVTLAAEGIDSARFLEFGEGGTLYVSIPTRGEILSLRDEDGDGAFEKKTTFVSGYASAHGMCWKDGELWL